VSCTFNHGRAARVRGGVGGAEGELTPDAEVVDASSVAATAAVAIVLNRVRRRIVICCPFDRVAVHYVVACGTVTWTIFPYRVLGRNGLITKGDDTPW
jgi:hypothetical protein